MEKPTLDQCGLKCHSLVLNTSPLMVGQLHYNFLQDKKKSFASFLISQKTSFETQLHEYLSSSSAFKTLDSHGDENRMLRHETNESKNRKLRLELQGRLDDIHRKCQERLNELVQRLQREWGNNPMEQEMRPTYPGSQNGAYLATILGQALEQGLSAVCLHQPEDPIEYLASWLKDFAMRKKRLKQDAIEHLHLMLAKEEDFITKEKEKQLKVEVKNQTEDEQRRMHQYKQRMLTTKNVSFDIEETDTYKETADASSPASSPPEDSVEEVTIPDESTNDNLRASVLYTIEEKDADEDQETDIQK